MRFLRLFTALLALSLVASVLAGGVLARAQTVDEAEDAADHAKQQSEIASGLVDSAVADRDAIEHQLADSITRLNELTAQLSAVGADIDRVEAQVGFADVELAGIQADIEHQAVDAYMTVVASPSVSVVNSQTVEEALVASSVVEDVVADGQLTVTQLFAKRKSLIDLQHAFAADQENYQALQAEIDAEVEKYTDLYAKADSRVAEAIRAANVADQQYRATLSAIDLARAKEAERQRQENRVTGPPSTSTSTTPSTETPPSSTPTTTAPAPSTTTSGGGSEGSWDHPPQVERWRPLVQQFFPSARVDEALAVIDCESNGDPDALNPYSGAAGLFQFLPSTWATTSVNAGYGGYSPFDPEANIASAAWLANRYQQLGYDYWHAWNCKRVLS